MNESSTTPPTHISVYEGTKLLEWKPFQSTVRLDEQERLLFRDLPTHSSHLIMLQNHEFLLRTVRLSIEVRPLPSCSTHLLVQEASMLPVGELSSQGEIRRRGNCERLEVERTESGLLRIDVVYFNRSPFLFIGTCLDKGEYLGTNREQFAIERIQVEWAPGTDPPWIPIEDPLRLVDVGSAGGLQVKWLPHLEQLCPILFEPNPAEARRLELLSERIPGARVLQTGLADLVGQQQLHLTRSPTCSSLLKPNAELLASYLVGPLFEVLATESVECTRYDVLFAEGRVPQPDAIKIDVQGFEYQVLQGFGQLLHNCLGIELESHFYPIYQGQRLLHELVELLQGYGLVLRDLRSTGNFDQDMIEVDAFFTMRNDRVATLSSAQQKKLALLLQVWGLPPHCEKGNGQGGQPIAGNQA